MGSNSMQAVGIMTFLAAFVLLAAGFAAGNVLLIIVALVLLGISAGVFLKAKPWEQQEG